MNKIKSKICNLLLKIEKKLIIKNSNAGMGVVEVILIILVLVGLAVIFRTKITEIVNGLFSKISTKVNTF